ncbi:unnamed protein product [Discosporangium mesarthrocarpum]
MNTILSIAMAPVDWLLAWPDKNNIFLKGMYAPAANDCELTECKVEGELPAALEGEFARNGPNPKFAPRSGYHWFDGDGMVHAVRIKDGKAFYSSHQVKTEKLRLETEAGRAVFLKLGDMSSILAVPRLLNNAVREVLGLQKNLESMRESTANTALEYHAGKLLALNEGGLPYQLRVLCDGVLETVGTLTYEGKMQQPFTAHPKLDPVSGKLYGFGYQLKKQPYMTFYVLDKEGKLERQFPITIPNPVMMHDMALTESYVVFLDTPLVMDPSLLIKGQLPLVLKKELGARFGLLPVDATDESSIRWFDLPEAFMTFHSLNAWEERGADGKVTKVNVVTCDMDEFDLDISNMNPDNLPKPTLTVLDLVSGEATRQQACICEPKTGMDFPQIPRHLLGRKIKYGYGTVFGKEGYGVEAAKMDLQASSPETAIVGKIPFGEGKVGGECLFIPNTAQAGTKQSEDDGFLVTFVINEALENSDLCVWNAKTMDPTPVARVKLPVRVPLGFHALFVSKENLAKQTV